MLKRIFLLLAICVVAAPMAQSATGDWRIHPYYVGANIKNIIDTDQKVYYLVGNELFCLDKANLTAESLNKGNILNDVLVSNIYYNHERKYLVVTYIDSNIDIVYSDGRVVNLPDISDMVLAGLKGINDVTFSNGKMFVATEFGLIVYDDDTMSVKESRLFGINFASIIEVGDWTVVSYNGYVQATKTSADRETYGAYQRITNIPSSTNVRLMAVDDSKFIVNAANGVYVYSTIADSAASPTTITRYVESSKLISSTRANAMQRTPNGFVISLPNSRILLDKNAENPQQVSITNELFSSNPMGDGTFWSLNSNGVHKAGESTYYKPNAIGINVGAFYLTYNKPKNLVYVSASSDNRFAEWGSGLGAKTQIFTHDGAQWTDVTPGSLPGSGVSANWQLVMDPFDPDTYVYPSRKYGVFKITNDKYTYKYDAANSYYGTNFYKGACAFDSKGNLWVVYSSNSASSASAQNVAVLPRAKYEQATCVKSDWIPVSVPGTKQKEFKGSSFVIGNNDVKVYNGSAFQGAFVFWKEKQGLDGEYEQSSFKSFLDEDGNSITWNWVYSMEKDQNGIVWACLSNGIIAFDPAKAFDDDFVVDHLKVTRTDGTGLYDFLLDGMQVNCIAVDAANCKWIGTQSNGVYQVSPDGGKILKHFTTDNSCMATNTVYGICCNSTNNSVYILMPTGFAEYLCDASPAAENYDDVYVYPNPVRPDFTGFLTVNNLMSDSYVKICNADGQVMKEMKSAGGVATWDCCDDKGERVATGLYSVYASQHQSDRNPAKVAEFLVIK